MPKAEDAIIGLDKLAQKLDLIAALFSHLLMSKVNLGQSNNHHAIFAMITFLDSGGTSCGSTISLWNAVTWNVLFLPWSLHVAYCQQLKFIFNCSIYQVWGNLWKFIRNSRVSSAQCIIHFVQYKSSSTQLKVQFNWSKIYTFVFPYILSSFSKFSVQEGSVLNEGSHLTQIQASMLDVSSYNLNNLSTFFYNASVLKRRKGNVFHGHWDWAVPSTTAKV